MQIIVVGLGGLGYYLTKVLRQNTNHKIKLIECDHLNSIVAANKLDMPVIFGDGSKISILKQAKADRCDILIALTGKDEDNFLCCQLAKKIFNVKTTIAKVNNPKNAKIMQKLAVDIIVSSAGMISKIVEQQLNVISHHFMTHFTSGNMTIIEFQVRNLSSIQNKKIKEVKWPEKTLVISIIRNSESIIPTGNTTIFVNDKLIISTEIKQHKNLKKLFN